MGTAAQSAKGNHRLGAYFDQPQGLFDLAVFPSSSVFTYASAPNQLVYFQDFHSPHPTAFSPLVFRSGRGGIGQGGWGTEVCKQVPSLTGQSVLLTLPGDL